MLQYTGGEGPGGVRRSKLTQPEGRGRVDVMLWVGKTEADIHRLPAGLVPAVDDLDEVPIA